MHLSSHRRGVLLLIAVALSASSSFSGATEEQATKPFSPGYTLAPTPPASDWIKPLDPQADARALFEKRILPIFKSPKASSCTECHLSGVDLKDYLFPDQEKTFAALLKGKLVDTHNPDRSKILEFISRRPEKTSLIKDQVRREEYEAFRAWLHAAVKDPQLLAAKPDTSTAGPSLPPEVIRHARTDRVLASFVENVWSEIERCTHCHDPRFNQKQVAREGNLMSWITPDDPLATLATLKKSGLLDLDEPDKSELLTKPTLEVEHKGGLKMIKGDRGYQQFLTFLQDYAATVKGTYARAADLPSVSEWVPTAAPLFLKVIDIPERYRGKPMQADVYAWTDQGWSASPAATGTWAVWPKKLMWQARLTLLAKRGSPEAGRKTLPSGRYLAKLYIDENGKLDKDPLAGLGASEFIGQVEFQAHWKPAFTNAVEIKFPMKQDRSSQ